MATSTREAWRRLCSLLAGSRDAGDLAREQLRAMLLMPPPEKEEEEGEEQEGEEQEGGGGVLAQVLHEVVQIHLFAEAWTERENAGKVLGMLVALAMEQEPRREHKQAEEKEEAGTVLLALDEFEVHALLQRVETLGAGTCKAYPEVDFHATGWEKRQRAALLSQLRLGSAHKPMAGAALKMDPEAISGLMSEVAAQPAPPQAREEDAEEEDDQTQHDDGRTRGGRKRPRRPPQYPRQTRRRTGGHSNSSSSGGGATEAEAKSDKTQLMVRSCLRFLAAKLLDERWETRHGACVALQSILVDFLPKTQGAEQQLGWLAEDLCACSMCVLTLDRFTDFSLGSSRAVSPVGTAAAQLLACAVRLAALCDAASTVPAKAISHLHDLLILTPDDAPLDWRPRNAALLGLQYTVAALPSEVPAHTLVRICQACRQAATDSNTNIQLAASGLLLELSRRLPAASNAPSADTLEGAVTQVLLLVLRGMSGNDSDSDSDSDDFGLESNDDDTSEAGKNRNNSSGGAANDNGGEVDRMIVVVAAATGSAYDEDDGDMDSLLTEEREAECDGLAVILTNTTRCLWLMHQHRSQQQQSLPAAMTALVADNIGILGAIAQLKSFDHVAHAKARQAAMHASVQVCDLYIREAMAASPPLDEDGALRERLHRATQMHVLATMRSVPLYHRHSAVLLNSVSGAQVPTTAALAVHVAGWLQQPQQAFPCEAASAWVVEREIWHAIIACLQHMPMREPQPEQAQAQEAEYLALWRHACAQCIAIANGDVAAAAQAAKSELVLIGRALVMALQDRDAVCAALLDVVLDNDDGFGHNEHILSATLLAVSTQLDWLHGSARPLLRDRAIRLCAALAQSDAGESLACSLAHGLVAATTDTSSAAQLCDLREKLSAAASFPPTLPMTAAHELVLLTAHAQAVAAVWCARFPEQPLWQTVECSTVLTLLLLAENPFAAAVSWKTSVFHGALACSLACVPSGSGIDARRRGVDVSGFLREFAARCAHQLVHITTASQGIEDGRDNDGSKEDAPLTLDDIDEGLPVDELRQILRQNEQQQPQLQRTSKSLSASEFSRALCQSAAGLAGDRALGAVFVHQVELVQDLHRAVSGCHELWIALLPVLLLTQGAGVEIDTNWPPPRPWSADPLVSVTDILSMLLREILFFAEPETERLRGASHIAVSVVGLMSSYDPAVRASATRQFREIVRLAPLLPGQEITVAGEPTAPLSDATRIADPQTIVDALLLGQPMPLFDVKRALQQLWSRHVASDADDMSAFAFELRDYQNAGAAWMTNLCRCGLHPLICDEMGLGKTLQTLCTIALLRLVATRPQDAKQAQQHGFGPVLVVCPSSVLVHWETEMRSRFPAGLLRPALFGRLRAAASSASLPSSSSSRKKLAGRRRTGRGRSKSAAVAAAMAASSALAAPTAAMTSAPRAENVAETALEQHLGSVGAVLVASYGELRSNVSFFARQHWGALVLDEAHVLKNPAAKVTSAVHQLRARHRFALTGTPVQNHVQELWSVFQFLFPDYLGDAKSFQSQYVRPIYRAQTRTVRQRHRRGSGSPATQPSSVDAVSMFDFSLQPSITANGMRKLEELHAAVLAFCLRRTKRDVMASLPPKIVTDVSCTLSSVQASMYRNAQRGSSSSSFSSSPSSANALAAMAPPAASGLVLAMYLRMICTHPALAVHSRHREYRESLVRDWSSSAKFEQVVALLVTSGVCDDDDISQADARNALPAILARASLGAADSGAAATATRGGAGNGHKMASARTDVGVEEVGQEEEDADDADDDDDDDDDDEAEAEDGDDGEEAEAGKNESDKELSDHRAGSAVDTIKCIIFAQHRDSLVLLEDVVFRRLFDRVACLRVDGNTSGERRGQIAMQFNSDPAVRVLLLTTRSCGLGLNLTRASVVIFLEQDWNPQADLQAMDRAHRLGQTRCVSVFRVYARDTIEEHIRSVQKLKTTVSDTVVNEKNSATTDGATVAQALAMSGVPNAGTAATPAASAEHALERVGGSEYDTFDMDNFLATLHPS